MRGEGRSLRTRTIAALWAVVHGHDKDEAWLYTEASSEIGRLLQPGFGITTCTDQEIGRILVRVKRALGLPTGDRRPWTEDRPAGSRRRSSVPRHDPTDVVRIATTGQFQLARALEAELHIGMDEAAGIAAKACGSRVPRTAVQVVKYIEGLKAIRARRMRQASGVRRRHRDLA